MRRMDGEAQPCGIACEASPPPRPAKHAEKGEDAAESGEETGRSIEPNKGEGEVTRLSRRKPGKPGGKGPSVKGSSARDDSIGGGEGAEGGGGGGGAGIGHSHRPGGCAVCGGGGGRGDGVAISDAQQSPASERTKRQNKRFVATASGPEGDIEANAGVVRDVSAGFGARGPPSPSIVFADRNDGGTKLPGSTPASHVPQV